MGNGPLPHTFFSARAFKPTVSTDPVPVALSCSVSEEIWYRVVQIITNQGDDLQRYAAQEVWHALARSDERVEPCLFGGALSDALTTTEVLCSRLTPTR